MPKTVIIAARVPTQVRRRFYAHCKKRGQLPSRVLHALSVLLGAKKLDPATVIAAIADLIGVSPTDPQSVVDAVAELAAALAVPAEPSADVADPLPSQMSRGPSALSADASTPEAALAQMTPEQRAIIQDTPGADPVAALRAFRERAAHRARLAGMHNSERRAGIRSRTK